MNSRRVRCRRLLALLAAVGSVLLAAPPALFALPEVVAVRGLPSSLSAEYGPAVPLGPAGLIAVPTGNGIEIRDLGQPAAPRLELFRTAGAIDRAARADTTLFLFAGSRGIVAVSVSDPAAPRALGSVDNLGRIVTGAAASIGGGVLAARDSALHFLTWNPGTGFTLLRSLTFADGRRVNAIAAQGDTFLVASTRPSIPNRLILTLYRVPSFAAPESLGEVAFNGHQAGDLAWRGPLAFIADGNAGVLVVNLPARVIARTVPVLGNKFVRSLDLNDSVLVVAAEGRTFVRFARTGALGDSLASPTIRITEGEPAHVRLNGNQAVLSTYDQIDVPPPDEPGRSKLEVVDLAGGIEPPPVGETGKTRRVVTDSVYAYVADYTGGLRIYRKDPADTGLVGLVAPSVNGRTVDVALDPVRRLVYLANGVDGLLIVDVSDPALPSPVGAVGVPGLASAVTVIRPDLVAVARRGSGAGVTFVEVSDPAAPNALGSVDQPFIQDARALAARDTVLFVADDVLGVLSIGFGNLAFPALIGQASGAAARDLDLMGTRLLVATRTRGLQIVDVLDPIAPVLRGEFQTPPLLGVEQNGSSAALFLGEDGVLVVDVTSPVAVVARGPIAVPGVAHDGAWDGDTLLVAAGFALERYLVHPAPTVVPAITALFDEQGAQARARLTWDPVSLPGMIGLNVYRDLDPASSGTALPPGRLVNRTLLPLTAVEAIDDSLTAGRTHRYRLEAFFADGSSRKVAEGTLLPSASARVGRSAPNPFRPGRGALASIHYRLPAGTSGTLRLDVHGVSGRLLRTITAPVAVASGFGTVAWDGRDRSGRILPSGIYFLHLTGAGLDDSRAITLLR